MKLISELVRKFSTPCLHCGSFLKSEGLLCESCRNKVETYIKPDLEMRTLGVFEAYMLFRWNPGTSDLLSAQLAGLKGFRTNFDWNYWANRFVSRRIHKALPTRRIILIPAPSSTGRTGDHAYQWAQALGKATGAEICLCLTKKTRAHQRGATRENRVQVEFALDENSSMVSEFWSDALWVFVDDIVTTGSTALAAYEALGRPPHFEAWALAQRTLACGD
ncbi:ComF family protein [Bdellovibrio sp. HCB274]|uniref:ComF family protein n=1 Tax=Bdellovibrio sp. HCB274 TaxID=3394361 RepID=UPI0039B64C9A